MSMAVISDPIGRFSSGWCELDAGVITCRIRPAMPTDHVFTIAFGPKLPTGNEAAREVPLGGGRALVLGIRDALSQV